MRVAILSRVPSCYSTRRLVEAAKQRGHEPSVLDVLEMNISLEEGYPEIFYHGEPLSEIDAALPRIGASVTYFGTAAVRQMEQMDIFVANTSLGILNSRDKLRALQILSRHNIGIPPTEFVRRKEDVLPAIERVGGAPVIIKLLEGTQGVGVILAESTQVARAIIETLQSAKQNVLIQKFVAESRGKDVRAIVVGERVVAAMRRVAQGQEYRSNVHRGGRAEPLKLDRAYTETAVRACQILGLKVAGVDMLESSDGPQVMEVNSSPGLTGIETATRVDVAGAIIDYMADMVRFPDMDLRQRLSVSRGYGVAEILVGESSPLLGKTFAEAGLREQKAQALTLHREGRVIANPKRGRVIVLGDRILCFGKLPVLRGMMPEVPRRRVRKLAKATTSDDTDS